MRILARLGDRFELDSRSRGRLTDVREVAGFVEVEAGLVLGYEDGAKKLDLFALPGQLVAGAACVRAQFLQRAPAAGRACELQGVVRERVDEIDVRPSTPPPSIVGIHTKSMLAFGDGLASS